MAESAKLQTARPMGPVRITIPAAVAYDLGAFQKGIGELVERLGCRTCFSGADCTFQHERDFVINEKLEVRAASRIATVPDMGPALPQDLLSVKATLPSKVSYNLKQIQDVVAQIAGRLGCQGCCSGFDITFLHERELIINEAGGIVSR